MYRTVLRATTVEIMPKIESLNYGRSSMSSIYCTAFATSRYFGHARTHTKLNSTGNNWKYRHNTKKESSELPITPGPASSDCIRFCRSRNLQNGTWGRSEQDSPQKNPSSQRRSVHSLVFESSNFKFQFCRVQEPDGSFEINGDPSENKQEFNVSTG